jgi:hypothetical protein
LFDFYRGNSNVTVRGGKRSGAGRKKGTLTKRTQEIVAAASVDGITPLEFMLKTLRDPDAKQDKRFEAAIAAAPYMHPKLAAVTHQGDAANPIHHVIKEVRRTYVRPGGK